MDIRVNVAFKSLKKWQDSEKRSEHVFDRMRERAVSVSNIKEAVAKGAKQVRADKSVVAEYRWLKVVYREFILKNTKKIQYILDQNEHLQGRELFGIPVIAPSDLPNEIDT